MHCYKLHQRTIWHVQQHPAVIHGGRGPANTPASHWAGCHCAQEFYCSYTTYGGMYVRNPAATGDRLEGHFEETLWGAISADNNINAVMTGGIITVGAANRKQGWKPLWGWRWRGGGEGNGIESVCVCVLTCCQYHHTHTHSNYVSVCLCAHSRLQLQKWQWL